MMGDAGGRRWATPSPSLICAVGLALAAALAMPSWGAEPDWSGSLELDLRGFFQEPAFVGQSNGVEGSVAFRPELRFRSENGRHRFTLVPFLRWDNQDDERSHGDLREAYWLRRGQKWDVVAGINKVFWGVAESRHLVDVINQTDLIEDLDQEDKLGQPMVQLATQRSWGSLELFAMPYFRERTFPGRDGRLRFPLVVDTDRAIYESGAEEHHLDGALRYATNIGDWDFGVYHFYGTGREPTLIPAPATGRPALIPRYDLIHQTGADVQYTRGAWLWKVEAMRRQGQGRTFGATVAGFEYTFYQAIGAADIGTLVEYLYDDRDATAPLTPFDDDWFGGVRLAFNDTQDSSLLAGAIIDPDSGEALVSIEGQRRLGSRFTAELEGRLIVGTEPGDDLSSFSRDDYVQLRLAWNF